MKRTLIVFTLIASFLISVPATSKAVGTYKWWTTSKTGEWFSKGIVCYGKQSNSQAGLKFNFSYKLGQNKKFVSLGNGVSISGDTQVDYQGHVADLEYTYDENGDPVDENGDPVELMNACNDSNLVAFISPKTPSTPGAYILKLTVYKKNGSVYWSDESKILAAYTGAESGMNFFTNPPNIFFTDATYANLSPSNGIKGYTSKGAPRNACLLIYDIAIKGGRSDGSITSSDLISSAQGGFFGANVRSIIGNAAIPTAIKCAPWVATYLW
jgi:hypothetical protein